MRTFPRFIRAGLRPWRATAVPVVLLIVLAACGREKRLYREVPPGASAFPAVRISDIQPGLRGMDPSAGGYQENRWAIGQGQM